MACIALHNICVHRNDPCKSRWRLEVNELNLICGSGQAGDDHTTREAIADWLWDARNERVAVPWLWSSHKHWMTKLYTTVAIINVMSGLLPPHSPTLTDACWPALCSISHKKMTWEIKQKCLFLHFIKLIWDLYAVKYIVGTGVFEPSSCVIPTCS